MSKVGILIFYANSGNLEGHERAEFFQNFADELKNSPEDSPLHLWECMVVPIRDKENYVQVIRNDGMGTQTFELDQIIEIIKDYTADEIKLR